jgi:hypothetical protein
MIFELYFREPISIDELTLALSQIFIIDTSEVGGISIDANVKLRYEINHYTLGDFKMRLSLYFADKQEDFGCKFHDELSFAIKFCRLLNRDILMSDKEPNPYTWLLISPSISNNPKTVYQIPNEADYIFLNSSEDSKSTA